MSIEVLDVFGEIEDFLPKMMCKGMINMLFKAVFYILVILLTLYHIKKSKDFFLSFETLMHSPGLYLFETYFISMTVFLFYTMIMFIIAGLLTQPVFQNMHCAKEVIVKTAFFYKKKVIKYKTYVALVLSLLLYFEQSNYYVILLLSL
ncbi:hypothetical protein [Sulfurimonas microaerophilic]|uniref:hypothetical protein n=1 Tax=Sulfurimonas microaerophilic TaxID=3058392 RepID=UPI00271497FB|nr:hypothetical protein [Sulfurimonas sp. hsl 1-7]